MEERRKNMENAFMCVSNDINGKEVIIIDDVCASGATLEACAAALKERGAKKVSGLTFTREILTEIIMEIKVSARNLKMTDDIREYAEKKLNKLSKYLSNITAAHMELEEEKSKSRLSRVSAQVTLNINGLLLRGEQKDDNVKPAIDAVTDVMERLIDKYKKRYIVNKSKVHESIRVVPKENDHTAEANRPVVKRKKFIVETHADRPRYRPNGVY